MYNINFKKKDRLQHFQTLTFLSSYLRCGDNFFYVGPPKEGIFLTIFYGLYFIQCYTLHVTKGSFHVLLQLLSLFTRLRTITIIAGHIISTSILKDCGYNDYHIQVFAPSGIRSTEAERLFLRSNYSTTKPPRLDEDV